MSGLTVRRGGRGPQSAYRPFEASEVEQSIVARFEAEVARHPDAPSISDGVYRWSYRELNGLANRIASAMVPDALSGHIPVVLLFEHGAPAIAAMLGLLKAGRYYVPLNPGQSPARLGDIFQDSGAGVIVTNDLNSPLALEISRRRARIFSIDELKNQSLEDNLGLSIAPDAFACVLFTSGSSGLPKGVVHNHRNIMHAVMNYTGGAHIAAGDRHSVLSSYDTSASICPIYATLLNGASVHPFDPRIHGPLDAARWLLDERITIYQSGPRVFRDLFAAMPAEPVFPFLRLIKLGGGATTTNDVGLYRKHFSKSAILQVSFGATEIAIIRMLSVDDATELAGPIVPVGYEVPDTEVVILDDQGREIGDGSAGEIAIRSSYLFCGYWKNPALTASVMSTCTDGRRIFRTGDRGMLERDGCLIHLGRRDSMVKIAGCAVEVAEVEAALLRQPGVSGAVVLGRPNRRGETRLIAYVVSAVTPSMIRRRLAETLPAPMIPSALIRMKALPTARYGKIDLSALPDPETFATGQHPPRDAIESALITIWEEALEIRPIGIKDDFFRLGGDSLLALELISRVENLYSRRIPMSLLGEAPTIEQQAKVLRDANWSLPWPAVVTLQSQGDLPGLFWIPGAGQDVISATGLARQLGTKQPFYGLQPPGQDGLQPPLRSVETLAAHFVREMRKVQPHGPYFLGGGSYGGLAAFEIAQQLNRAGDKVALLALFDGWAPPYPALRLSAPFRFQAFHRLGGVLVQTPERPWTDIAREIVNIWRARFFIRMRLLRGRGLTPGSVYFHFLQVAHRARDHYRPLPYPGKITLLRHLQQPSAEIYRPDPLLGWAGLACGGLEVIDIKGIHGKAETHDADEIADKIRACLRAAQDSLIVRASRQVW